MRALLFVMMIAFCFAEVKKVPTVTPTVQKNKIEKVANETKPGNITKPIIVTQPIQNKEGKEDKKVKEVKQNENVKTPTKEHKKLVKKYRKQLALTLQKLSLEDRPYHNRLWKVEKKFFKLHKQTHNLMDKFDDLKHARDMI